MSMSYSNTTKNFNPDNSFEYKETEKIKGASNFSRLMKIIIISAIALIIVSGIIILAVLLSKKNKSEDKRKQITYIDVNSTSTQNVTLNTDKIDDSTYVEEPIENNITYNSNINTEEIESPTIETDGNLNYIKDSENIKNSTYIEDVKESEIIDNSTIETDSNQNLETDSNQNYIEDSVNIKNSTYIEDFKESEIIDNSTIETDNDDNSIYVKPKATNITYNEGQLKFFNIEKNISSKILGESNKTQENDTYNYLSVLGVKSENKEENTNKTYYEGFFAILSGSYFNKSINKEESLLYNKELNNIINEDNQNKLIRNLEEQYLKQKENDDDDDEDYEEIKPFLEISFYKDGTYKEINRPYNLSEENYKEMKDCLDLIIPKISNDSIFVKKIDQETIEKVREDIQISNSLKNDNTLRNLHEKKSFNYIKILRKTDEQNNTSGYKIKGENSNESYYIDDDIEHYSYMGEHEEENNITNLNCIDSYEDNLTKLNTYEHSGVYSEFTEYRGSNITKNISIIIDESNGLVKEIFSMTYMNVSKQEYLSQTDKDVYNEDNQIKENLLINAHNEINISNETTNITEKNEENNYDTEYDAEYDLKDAKSIITVIFHHIIINISYYDGKVIDNIYKRYLNNFTYEENNSTFRILNKLKRVLSLNDLDKYQIIEENNFRNLKEYEGEKFYGLKMLSQRKNVFQTNFLGLDIALGLANTYYPSTGQSYYSFKLDIGDYKVSRNIKSFKTNQPIIIENIQQMSFKLLNMIYSTHINLEKQNIINYNKINSILKNLSDGFNTNIVANKLFSNRKNIYLKFSINKEQYQIYIDDLLNSMVLINNNLTDLMDSFNSAGNILKNYINNFIDNYTDEVNIKLYDIEKAILDLNIEIKKNKDIESFLYLYEDYRSLIEKIKWYINYSLNEYIEKELLKGEILFISEKDNNIIEIMNLNKINIIINSIENEISNYIFSNEEKNLFSSYLKEFKNKIETYNISSSFDSLAYIFQNAKQIKIISSIFNLLEETEDYLNEMKEYLPEYKDIEEYYNQINKMEETINDIITFYIKYYSNIFISKYNYAYESINNKTQNFQKKALDFGKSIKNYLFEIKNEKNLNDKNLEETYFENNMFDLYNISNQKIEFFLKEDSEFLTSFDKVFIESVNNLIIFWTKYYIDKNFELAYEYLNETIDKVENCYDLKYFNSLLKCDYYLSDKFILTLNDMSKQSIQIVQNIDTNDFLNVVEEYYNSFKKELSQKQLKINDEICSNNKGFSYLNNINEEINFDFTKIKSYIKSNTIENLYQYSYEKQKRFLYDFNYFTEKKKGKLIYNVYDILISYDYYVCKSRNNYMYIYTTNSLIKSHLKENKESILKSYLETQGDISVFSENYCNNLILSLKGNSNENKFRINLYFILEKYRSDIINIFENITNYEFIKEIFDEYQHNFYDISLTKKIEYLNELINNLNQIYINSPYLIGNAEIQKIDDTINLLKNLEDYKKDSDVDFMSLVKLILENKVRMIINLNEKIFNYILSDLNKDENLENEIELIEMNFEDINKTIYKYKNIYQNNLEKISNSTKNESFDFLDIFKGVKNFSSIIEILDNNTKNNNTTHNNLLLQKLNEIKIQREIEGIKRLISNNKYYIDIDKKLIPELNIDNVKFLYEQIRFNISNEAKNIINNDIKPETNNLVYNYSIEIFYEIEKLYKNNYENNGTLYLFKELISEISCDFIEEVEKDLNISYHQLFDLIGKYIILNNTYQNIDFKFIKKKYYNEILNYFNFALDSNNINNTKRNYDKEKEMKNIIFISIKRLEEKKIRYIKSYLNSYLKKYECFDNEESTDSRVSTIYEEKKIEELYPLYLEIFKEINSTNFELPDMNKNKTSFEKIKNITLNLYEKNFNIFKENFVYENINYYYNESINDSLLNLIEEEIENILNKIKNIIENSIKEAKNISLDGYYLKRHIINSFENKITLDIPKNFNSINDFINNNSIIMENLKTIEEKIYNEKISNKLIEVLNFSIKDYYYNLQCYELEVSRKIILLNDNYFYSMFFYSKKLLNNTYNYLSLIIDKDDRYQNSTYDKIRTLSDNLLNIILKQIEENLDIFYSEASYLKNKNILIKASINTIFNDKYMNEILFTNSSKNLLLYNDIIISSFKNYIDKIIYFGSKSFVKFCQENRYYDSEIYWTKNINPIFTKLNISSYFKNTVLTDDYKIERVRIIYYVTNELDGKVIFGIKYDSNFTKIDNLIKILEKNINNLDINDKFIMNNETLKLIMIDIEEKYKINGIDRITNKYENLMKAVIESNITSNLTPLNSSYLITESINDINNIINNYSISLITEIKSYYSKLKIFCMIDGLNYIPIEKAEKLRVLWDYSNNSNYRKLKKSTKRGKLLNIKTANEYLNKLDKKGKKDILKKLETIFNNNSSLRHLDEYNTRALFNSASQPLSLNNISNMIDNLNDDINNFNNMIKNDDYFNKIKIKNELLKTNSEKENNIIELNNKLLKSELSFIFLFNSNIKFDSLDNLASFEMKNKPEKEVENLTKKLIDFIENNNKIKYLKELSNGIILSIYNIFSNTINKQSKVINTNDEDINYYFNKFIDNVDKLLEVVGVYKIFSKVKKVIENIVDAISGDIDGGIEEFSDELEISGGFEDFSYGAVFDDDKFSVFFSKCYELDIIEKVPLFPLKLKCPGFPPLQIRFSPVVLVKACGQVIYESEEYFHTSKLSFDFNTGATIGFVLEGGFYFDVKVFKLTIKAGIQGNFFDGKVGIKFSINFTKARLTLNIYSEYIPLSFEFFIKVQMKIIFFKITLVNISYKYNVLRFYSSIIINLDLYEMIDNFSKDESYYLL